MPPHPGRLRDEAAVFCLSLCSLRALAKRARGTLFTLLACLFDSDRYGNRCTNHRVVAHAQEPHHLHVGRH